LRPFVQSSFSNGRHFKNLRGDIYLCLIAAIVALSLAMAINFTSSVGSVACCKYCSVFTSTENFHSAWRLK
jgi:hypothetical protein